ncbi:MAG: hypothetical protein PF450_06255 [Bacteroidales bacterium]|jgi:hypothetical protein|nr:hypothetical protein [Bacteroidales bacterium]
MKNLRSKTGMSIIVLLLIAGVTVFGQKAEKELKKDYDISEGFTMGIDNKYGSIEVVNWDKDELSVVVTITVEATSQDKAEKLLDGITVDISEEESATYFDTKFDLPKLSGKNNFNVNYTVSTPSYLNVNLEQKYGNVFIQEISGEAIIDVSYGNVNATKLVRDQKGEWNAIEVGYGNISIEETGALTVELKYGAIDVVRSGELSIESAYSKLALGDVNSLSLESKYDKVVMEKMIGSVMIESAYTQVNLGSISKNFNEISAEMSYGNLKGELDPNASFTIDAEAAYGSISIPDGSYHSSKENNRHTVVGEVGSSPDALIEVSLRYGSMKF